MLEILSYFKSYWPTESKLGILLGFINRSSCIELIFCFLGADLMKIT